VDDRFYFAGPQQLEHLPEALMRPHGTADLADLPAENTAHVNVALGSLILPAITIRPAYARSEPDNPGGRNQHAIAPIHLQSD